MGLRFGRGLWILVKKLTGIILGGRGRYLCCLIGFVLGFLVIEFVGFGFVVGNLSGGECLLLVGLGGFCLAFGGLFVHRAILLGLSGIGVIRVLNRS